MHANPFVSRRFGADGYTEVRDRLRRVEVFGSPHIRWAKARVERTGARLFNVEAMLP